MEQRLRLIYPGVLVDFLFFPLLPLRSRQVHRNKELRSDFKIRFGPLFEIHLDIDAVVVTVII